MAFKEASSSGVVCGKDIVLAINDFVFLFFITMPPIKVPRATSTLEITAAIRMNKSSTAVAARVMRREGLDPCQRHTMKSLVARRTKPPPRDSTQLHRKRGPSENKELRFASTSNKALG
ncbi:hypothetical protein ACLOJK_023304, partial [Asimina triloba]